MYVNREMHKLFDKLGKQVKVRTQKSKNEKL